MRMTASYRKASGCIQWRNRQQEERRNTRFWQLGAHSDETAKKRSEVAVARCPPMVSAPRKRMGCCCFGASPSMRIVASWFGSSGSTVYKDVAAGFDNHRQLESGLHLVSFLLSGRSRLGSIGVGFDPSYRFEFACHVTARAAPIRCRMPPCSGQSRPSPFGWPRKTRPALTGPARGGRET
jgi:hypothetical protein